MRVLIVAGCLLLAACGAPPPGYRPPPPVFHPAQFPQQPMYGTGYGGISPTVLVNGPNGAQMNCTRIGNIVNCN